MKKIATLTHRKPVRLNEGLGYVYIAPALVVVALVLLVPLCYTLGLSLFDYDLYTRSYSWAGLEPILTALKDKVFANALKNTMVWTVGSVFFQFILGFMLALIVNSSFVKRKTQWRILLMIPWVLPSVVSAMVWKWCYHSDYGIINEVLKQLGLISKSISWIGSKETALLACIIVNVWKMVPFVMLMMEAALQNVSAALREAAQLDGANPLQIFWSVTIPGVRTTMNTVICLLTIWTMNSFTFIYLLTEGGPNRQSQTVAIYIYEKAFKNYDFGGASAAATILFVATAAVVYVYNRYAIKGED